MLRILVLGTLFSVLYSSVAQARICATDKRDCAEIQASLAGYPFDNGVYLIKPGPYGGAVDVRCDMITDNGGWTTILRRFSGKTTFHKYWNSYESGFGSPYDEYWLGLKYIHWLTNQKCYKLKVELWDWSDHKRYAEYSHFLVGDSGCNYKLISIGDYCGDAGDSLSYHVGSEFSTYDKDNDKSASHCAQKYIGGWWYNNCLKANLNGKYMTGKHNLAWEGIVWERYMGQYYSYKRVEMKIRPCDY